MGELASYSKTLMQLVALPLGSTKPACLFTLSSPVECVPLPLLEIDGNVFVYGEEFNRRLNPETGKAQFQQETEKRNLLMNTKRNQVIYVWKQGGDRPSPAVPPPPPPPVGGKTEQPLVFS